MVRRPSCEVFVNTKKAQVEYLEWWQSSVRPGNAIFSLKLSDPKYDFSDSGLGQDMTMLDLRGDALIVFVILLK